jgi:hypothetical protein
MHAPLIIQCMSIVNIYIYICVFIFFCFKNIAFEHASQIHIAQNLLKEIYIHTHTIQGLKIYTFSLKHK